MLVVFAYCCGDTKIIYGYNFVAPLRRLLKGLTHFLRSIFGKKWAYCSPTLVLSLQN